MDHTAPKDSLSEIPVPALPRVAVIIPILNEARTLGRTCAALINQDYPHGLIEVLIVDTGSTDNWESQLTPLYESAIDLRTLRLAKRNTSAAVNQALSETTAPKVLWISGHCVLSPGYISALVNEAGRFENVVPGGQIETMGENSAGTINALILGSRFGTGTAPWRFRRSSGWAASATYALFDRAQLLRLGGLDERLVRNQDTELIARLKRDGTRYRLVDSTATYIAPSTFRGFWRRAWGNGSWGIWGRRLGWDAGAWYHFVPMMAACLGMILTVLALWSTVARIALIALVAVYLVMTLGTSITLGVKSSLYWTIPVLPLFIFIHHLLYGLGACVALFRKPPIDAHTDTLGDPALRVNR